MACFFCPKATSSSRPSTRRSSRALRWKRPRPLSRRLREVGANFVETNLNLHHIGEIISHQKFGKHIWVFPKKGGFYPQNGWWKSWKTLWTNGWFRGYETPYFWKHLICWWFQHIFFKLLFSDPGGADPIWLNVFKLGWIHQLHE